MARHRGKGHSGRERKRTKKATRQGPTPAERQQADALRAKRRRVLSWIGAGVGFVLSGYGLYQLWLALNAEPHLLSPPPVDLAAPFAGSFALANESNFTFTEVHPLCVFDDVEFGAGNRFVKAGIERAADVGTIRRGRTAKFQCGANIVNEPIARVRMHVEITYRVGWLPWKQARTHWLELMRDSKGEARWEVGHPLREGQ